MMIRRFTVSIATLAALASASPLLAATPIDGRWITNDGKAIVDIAPCGQALCGKIVQPLKPDPADTSKVGYLIMTDLTDAGDYWKGTIHRPEDGKTIAAKVNRNADGTLTVQGCVAVFCKTMTWTKAR